MKVIVFTLITFLLGINVLAQDYEPQQHKFLVGIDSVYLSPSMDIFKQEEFILGWHWAGPRKLSKEMNTNVIINFW